jgi:hypothetical protein
VQRGDYIGDHETLVEDALIPCLLVDRGELNP